MTIYDNNVGSAIYNSSEYGNINITLQVYQSSYNFTIESSYGYLVYSFAYTSLSSVQSTALYQPDLNIEAILDSNSTLSITFSTGLRTLTVSEIGLIDSGWSFKLLYGTNPSQLEINSTVMPLNDLSSSNFIIYSSTLEFTMSFVVPMHNYTWIATSSNKQYVAIPSTAHLNLNNNMSLQLNFSLDYPTAKINPIPAYLPIDTILEITQNSSAGIGTTITNYNWTISINNTVMYYKTATITPYFNQVGTYTITLTITNALGLSNSTSVKIFVEKFFIDKYILLNVKQIEFTNTLAEYTLNVSVPKNTSIVMADMLIDSQYSANTMFINETANSTLYFYNYAISFDPNQYSIGNHSLNFSAYDSGAGYNYAVLYMKFGQISTSNSKPFNLIDFFGGPATFWEIIIGIIGVIVTVASIKVSRTSDVIIESGGKESILKAKPVKQSTTQKIANFEKKRKAKKLNNNKKNRKIGGRKL